MSLTYYQRNKDKFRKYYLENRDKLIAYQKDWIRNNYTRQLWLGARCRAKKKNIPFKIKIEDIIIPETCPILGIPLISYDKANSPNSPSLDRKIPELGYIKENIQIISRKANTMKSNATPEELERFARWVLKI